ncbi:MAG TPA: hypothetical protein VFQ35_26155 [Polyangiaceae bacterium]|nr:hypothetical protein [Polyangiaceae bacterium]
MIASQPMVAPALELEVATPRGSGKLGRAGEFLVVGGATLPLLPLALLLRRVFGLDSAELAVGFVAFHAAHVINDPHFAVTYLLFYRNVRERAFSRAFSLRQRARYWIAGVGVPVLLGGFTLFALARHSAEKVGYLLQLMFLLVGWHYVKQGFGVLTVISARHGVRLSTGERRAFLAHCVSAWLFARANPRDFGHEASSDGVYFMTFPHPPGLELATRVAFAASALGLGFVLVRKWRREGRLPPLAALVGFLVTVWLWTAFSRIDPLLVYVIPALHSIQYLYFVWLSRRNEAVEKCGPPAFESVGKAMFRLSLGGIVLGWFLFRGLPPLLDEYLVLKDPFDPLGETPYFAALGTFVNIHHYFMDSVIWRRENPETRYLLTRA